MKKIKSSFLFLMLFTTQVQCQNWVAVGGGVDQVVNDLFCDTFSNKLFVAGNFQHAGGHQTNGVAAWDGQNWDTLNGGMDQQSVRFTVRYNGILYCFGYFLKSNGLNGIYTHGMASWNGASWDSVNSGFEPIGPVNYLINNNLLYVTGTFASANNISSGSAVIWDGMNFISIGLPHAAINSGGPCAFYNGNFYMAGPFADSSYSLYHLSYWDGSQWNQVSSIVDGDFLSMAVYHNELYLSGYGITGPGQHIIKFDGTNFTGVGGDLDAYALKLKVIDDRLFAVGSFEHAGGIACSKIAIWDGISWSPLSNDTFNSGISDLEIYNNELYVSGGFSNISGNAIYAIAKYTGTLTTPELATHSVNFNASFNIENSLITISFPSPLLEDAILTATDVMGRKLMQIIIPKQASRKELNFSDLSRGIYFITLTSPKGSLTKKIIKE